MLILAYLVCCGKCKTLVRTAIVEQSLDNLSDGCLIKIVDLRAAGHNPFFLDKNGKRIKILKKQPGVGVYSECTPVHRPESDSKHGKPARYFVRKKHKRKPEQGIKYRESPTAQFELSDINPKRIVCRLIADDFILERTNYKLLKAVYDRLWEKNIPCALIGDKK